MTRKNFAFARLSPEEAAALIRDGETVGTSGFTLSGYPKAIPKALAARAARLHAEGEPFGIQLYTGASTGDDLDGALARSHSILKRLPYQSSKDLNRSINSGETGFVDFHLSHLPQYLHYGFIDRPTTAIVEAVDVTPEGRISLTTSAGMSATYVQLADRVLIELNRAYPESLKGFHDIYLPKPPPSREPLPIHGPGDRIGTPYVACDPGKILGIVETDALDAGASFKPADPNSEAMAAHICEFLKAERSKGRLPDGLPFQVGVGNVANAVLASLARDPGFEKLDMYTEVIQDSVFDLADAGKLGHASASAFSFSPAGQRRFLDRIEEFRGRFILRPQEISNHPEIIRRLGIIAMNTALEMDIFGNVNSTHVLGSIMKNGIGGSGDFTRNSYLSLFMAPSVQKGGAISAVVPQVTHVDHNEHSVQILVTEQGLADLRGLSPVERARRIIRHCAHPDYRPLLTDYLEYGLMHAPSRHTPMTLKRAFEFHRRFQETGSMRT